MIRPSNSPYRFSMVPVIKPNGSIRITVNYQRLNQITVKDNFPLPLIDEILESSSGATIFTVLDIRAGYWQIPLHHDDSMKTAFTAKFGL